MNNANFTDSMLILTNMEASQLSGTVFKHTRYEVENVPNVNTMQDTVGLDSLCYLGSPKALVELRDALNKAGMTVQASKVNYSFRTWYRIHNRGSLDYPEWIFVSLTTRYGQAPFRPLGLIATNIIFFFFIYWYVLTRSKKEMIFETPISVKTGKADEEAKPVLQLKTIKGGTYALFLSILFAFRIGWRDIDVGSWIERLQPNAAEIRTQGWIRTIAGIQSLISVFLLALWLISIINGYI